MDGQVLTLTYRDAIPNIGSSIIYATVNRAIHKINIELMKEYYSVLESGYKVLGFAAVGLIFIIIGIGFITYLKKIDDEDSKINFAYIWTGFAVLWTIIAFLGIGSEYLECRSVIKNGTYQEVEGIVEKFEPEPLEGHKNESFTVKGVSFSYSDAGPSSGFNNSKSHGGPIDEGKYVRIRYHKGLILQLWIKGN